MTDGTAWDGAPTVPQPFGPYLGFENTYCGTGGTESPGRGVESPGRAADSPDRAAEPGTPVPGAGSPFPQDRAPLPEGSPVPASGCPARDRRYGPHPGESSQYAAPGERQSPPGQHPSPEGPYPAADGQHPGTGGPQPDGPGADGRWLGAAGSRRALRWLRRILLAVGGLVLLLALLFAVLLLVTPSVGNAPALAEAIARSHHAIYPGPPVPPRFAAALTSTEDHRFYSEPGIDPFAIARVIIGRITGAPDQGGATLYQQLAKMLYTPRHSGLAAQTEQIVLGIKLDMSYPKSKILQMYADVTFFGHGYFGLAAASCGYFRRPPGRLSWAQAAMLAGLVQAPTAYDPLAHYAIARARQAHVLRRLVATGALSQARASWAYRQPLHLAGGPATGCAAG